MKVNRQVAIAPVIPSAIVLVGLFLVTTSLYTSGQVAPPGGTGQVERDLSRPAAVFERSTVGSAYIPVDTWIYTAAQRLYLMGYIDEFHLVALSCELHTQLNDKLGA
jgi:hypothetical protein